MDLENIECQLAQAQMARYLAGDQLPEDTVLQLEKHVKDCENCQAAAQEKKISLQEMLESSRHEEPAPTPANTEEAAELSDNDVQSALDALLEQQTEAEPIQPLVAQVAPMAPGPVLPNSGPATSESPAEEPDSTEPAEKKKFKLPAFALPIAGLKEKLITQGKPMLLGFALGGTLIGTTFLMRHPTQKILGPKVIESAEQKPEEVPEEKKPEVKKAAEKKPKPQPPIKKPEPKPVEAKKDVPAAKEQGTEHFEVAGGDSQVKSVVYEGGKVKPVEPKPAPKPKPKPESKMTTSKSKPSPKPAPQPRKHKVHHAPGLASHHHRRSHHKKSAAAVASSKTPKNFVKVYDDKTETPQSQP